MNQRWLAVVEAGHAGHIRPARAALGDADRVVRELALGALERCGALTDDDLRVGLNDDAHEVRRRAAELCATRPGVDLLPALADPHPTVTEQAVWACGEHEVVSMTISDRLIELATGSAEPLVREAAVAALGAIGDERGLAAILIGTADLPAVRRRAVLALAPFDGDEVEAAIERALVDRDWQVRQAAEDLRRSAD